MGYLAFPESGGASMAMAAKPVADAVPAASEQLTALEWSVVKLARKDRLASLRAPGRLTTALRRLFREPNPVLADSRLEALRRIAVLTWHYGYTVPSHEVSDLLAAGFTTGQYETMANAVNAAKVRIARAIRSGPALGSAV